MIPIAFTPREREIVSAAAAGNGQSAIAEMLGICRRTCCAHLQNIYAKIGIGGPGANKGPRLTAWAIEHGYGKGGSNVAV